MFPNKIRASLKCVQYAILCVLAAIIIYPLLFFILSPVLIYRQVIKFIVKISDPKCGAMLTGMDATLATPEPYKNTPITLVPYFLFNSKVERSHLVKVINEQMIEPNIFPELTQRIVRRYGYFFRYPVDNFNVEDHVKYLHPDCPDRPVKISEVRRLGLEWMGKLPFDSKTSPWELVVVPNFVDESYPTIKSCIFLRVNHSLADGYSMMNFIQAAAQNPWKIDVDQSVKKGKSIFWEMCKFLEALITGPYHAINLICFSIDNSEFLKKSLSIITEEDDESYHTIESEPRKIDEERLKNVKKIYNASVTSVLTTIVVEGVTRYIRQKCQEGYCEMPKRFFLQMTLPFPGHPKRMTNHWTFTRMPVDVTKTSDVLKTLTNIHNQFDYLKTSVVPLVTFSISKLIGLLPICFVPKVDDIPSQTILLLNMPGPSGKVDIFGYDWVDFGFVANGSLKMPFGISIQYMKGKFWIHLMSLKSLLKSQEEFIQVENYIHDVLDELENTGCLKKDN